MTTKLAAFLVGLALILPVFPALAHHTVVAIYDNEQPITLTGTVTKFDWRNPHVWFYMDVKDANGQVTNWGFELNGLNVLSRAGWTRSTLKVGDTLTVQANRARSGGPTANAREVTTGTGQKLLTRQQSTLQ